MFDVEQQEELYRVELCDDRRFLVIETRRVLDVLDGHLISLS